MTQEERVAVIRQYSNEALVVIAGKPNELQEAAKQEISRRRLNFATYQTIKRAQQKGEEEWLQEQGLTQSNRAQFGNR